MKKPFLKKPVRPPSPRNLFRGKRYIPPVIIPCESIADAAAKLLDQGFRAGRLTPNFYQHADGRTAVIQDDVDNADNIQIYIRGNQPNQI